MLSFKVWATHSAGGDISYRGVSVANGIRYTITLTLYQDCINGEPEAIAQDNPAILTIFPLGAGQQVPVAVLAEVASVTDIVPPNFSNDCVNNPPKTCLRRQIFQYSFTAPSNHGGFTLVYQRCCRNATINNITNPSNIGTSLEAVIGPSSSGPNMNSAAFVKVPPQIICVNNPFVYDHSAIDPDNDSLVYSFGPAYRGADPSNPKPNQSTSPPYPLVPYRPPFTQTNPMGGNPLIRINAQTGLITGTPNVMGIYVVTVYVHEYNRVTKQLKGYTKREFQFNVTNCSKAVVADIPILSQEPNTYIVDCQDLLVDFINTSTGGFRYNWDFGDPNTLADTSSQFQPSYLYPDTGTYTVKLVVNRGSTCPDSIERYVKVYPGYNANFLIDGEFCPENEIKFTDSSWAAYGVIDYWDWNFDDGTFSQDQDPTHRFPNETKDFQVTLISGSNLGCRDTITKPLRFTKVEPNAGKDTVIVKDVFMQLNGKGGVVYSWTPPFKLSDPNVYNPVFDSRDTGVYTYVMRIETDNHCVGYDTINITVADKPYLLMPNGFTPNGDGINDRFMPKFAGYRINFFRVYNRYGEQVFFSNSYEKGWDGTYKGQPAELGTYYWMLDGIDLFNKRTMIKGDVILFR
jgi:gliding motility-associated-like protein